MSKTIEDTKGKPLVGIIMGSDSDLLVMTETARMLEKFAIPYEIEVTSAHRSPARTHTGYSISAFWVTASISFILPASGPATTSAPSPESGPSALSG